MFTFHFLQIKIKSEFLVLFYQTWTNTKFSILSPLTKPLAGLQYHIEYLRHWIVCGCSSHVVEYALPSGKIFYKNDSFLPLKYCFINALRLSEVKLSSKIRRVDKVGMQIAFVPGSHTWPYWFSRRLAVFGLNGLGLSLGNVQAGLE